MLGSGAIMVLSEDVCIVKALEVVMRFYAHESCGQCPPCREGTFWLHRLVSRIERGGGKREDIDKIVDICPDMMGRTVCVLADAAAMPAASYVKKFRAEFESHVEQHACPMKAVKVGEPG
jgi:NADH-quinone oxidoreductase subunit F